jgi:hypothetical protein
MRYGYIDWYSEEDESDNVITVLVEVLRENEDTYLCHPIGGFQSREFPKDQVRLIIQR